MGLNREEKLMKYETYDIKFFKTNVLICLIVGFIGAITFAEQKDNTTMFAISIFTLLIMGIRELKILYTIQDERER